jgi:hypothetical protein
LRKLIALTALVFFIGGTSTAQAQSNSRQVRKQITNVIKNTQYRQAIIGMRQTPTRYQYKHLAGGGLQYVYRKWVRIASFTWRVFTNPPHKNSWYCIHHFEGSWSDSDDPYWGGLQMDRGFMKTYAPLVLRHRGFANRWSPLEQMWVAERAHRSGRGFGPWPNTAHYCGLL